MKILHVGDIHLGCRLDNNSRNEEIGKVFEFIRKLVEEREIEATLLAGDVFDNGHPLVDSQDMYYNFLLDLQKAGCKQTIVIAGNHDNPGFLDAPKWLLKRINIHVVGKVDTAHLEQEVVPLGEVGNPAAIVCAVPQLSHRDVCGLVPEGSAEERSKVWALGVAEHYKKVWEIANELRKGQKNIPIIGMGHLYALGSTFRSNDGNDDNNVVGKLEGIDMDTFANGYAYMALGHIHKPQRVAGHGNWRYAGSILPMKIQENSFVPQVIVLDTADLSNPEGVEIPDSCIHKMLCIKGNLEELKAKLQELSENDEQVWVKLVYTDKENKPNWTTDLRLEFKGSCVQIVDTEVERDPRPQPPPPPPLRISQMTPLAVFEDHLTNHCDYPEEQQAELRKLFLVAHNAVIDPREAEEAPPAPVAGLMKFKKLLIENVNSLYGENTIDFDAPEYNTGIFLISGPTGAGKSSILDAICLALYRATPRAGAISSTHNPIMSQGQNEMRAELTFHLGENEYRAVFKQKRTKTAQEPFQAYEHRLYKNGEEVQVKGSSYTRPLIEGLIGMKLEQFNQCVLLAQGSFAKFLNSSGAERAPLLTQITGTEIYNKIGKQIYTECEKAKKRKESLNDRKKGIAILSEVERESIANELQAKQETLATLVEERRICDAIELIFGNIARYTASVQEGEQALRRAVDAQNAAAPQRASLDAAQRAQHCEAAYTALQAQEDNWNNANARRNNLQASQARLEKILADAAQAATQARENLEALENTQEEKARLFQEVRGLDIQIRNTEQQAAEAQRQRNTANARQVAAQNTYNGAVDTWNQQRTAAEASTNYLNAHLADRELANRREGWELRRAALVALEGRNAEEVQALAGEERALNSKKTLLKRRTTEKNQKAASLQEVTTSIENLESAKNAALGDKSVEELNDLRAAAGKLQDFFNGNNSREAFLTSGQPCPLCGSTSHPYCDGTAEPENHDYSQDVAALNARLNTVRECDNQLDEARPQKERLRASLEHLEETCKELETEINDATTELQKHRQALEKSQEQASNDARTLQNELCAALQVEWTDHAQLPAELQERIEEFENAQSVVDGLKEARQVFDRATAAYNAVAQRNADELAAREQALADANARLADLRRQRHELFGNDDVATCEKAFARQLENARQAGNASSKQLTDAEANLRNNAASLEANANDLATIAEVRQNCQDAFTVQLQENGFENQEEFCQKRMETNAIEQLRTSLAALDTAVTNANATLVQRRATLADEVKRLPQGANRQANLLKQTELQASQTILQAECNNLNSRLILDDEHLKETEAIRRQLAEINPLCDNWTELNRVFGNSDGSAFARIAQGYTFRELIYCANQNRLSSLENHFELVSDKADPLELNVIDHYRGNQVRTSRNLSGGESFEVSLALALGLANMSSISQHASLGNVLLDEGFGTLDENALDSALELLMQLNNTDGKLVGIISHVAKLADKIPTQIKVSSNGGIGTLEGAGIKPSGAKQ